MALPTPLKTPASRQIRMKNGDHDGSATRANSDYSPTRIKKKSPTSSSVPRPIANEDQKPAVVTPASQLNLGPGPLTTPECRRLKRLPQPNKETASNVRKRNRGEIDRNYVSWDHQHIFFSFRSDSQETNDFPLKGPPKKNKAVYTASLVAGDRTGAVKAVRVLKTKV